MATVATVKIDVDAREASQKLKELVGLSGELETKTQSGSQSFNAFGKAAGIFAAKLFTVKAAVDAVKKGIEVAFERGATEQRLKNLTGSTEEFSAAMGAASKISNDFGISQNQAARELTDLYARLQGAGFGLKEITEIYRGFEAIAKTTGTTNEVASRTFLQLEQALSKGKLQGQDFLSVAGNMPGVLDAIAAEAGVARGELRAMSSQGEITGDLIYRALARANEGFDGIESRLNKQQKAFNDLNTVVERLNTVIGNVFGPILVAGIELVAAVSEKLADWWEYLYKIVLPKVAEAFKPLSDAIADVWGDFPAEEILGWIQTGLIIQINNIISAIKLISPILAEIVHLFNTIGTGGQIKFIVSAVEKIAGFLGITNTEVREFHENEKLAAEEAAKLVENFSSLPEAAGQANQAVNEMEQSLTRSVQALENQATAIGAQIERLSAVGSIVGARLDAEKALNDLQKTRLTREYESATTAQRRYDIAVKLFNNEVEAARIEYQQALAGIKLEESKLQLQLNQEVIKGKQILAEGQLQLLKAGSVEEEQKIIGKLQGALNAQNAVISATSQQIEAQKIIGEYQAQSAEAQFKNKVETAATALQQKLVSDEIGLSATRASSVANNLAAGATNSATMAQMGTDLQQKLTSASNAVEQGVKANQGAVQQFSTAAIEAKQRQDEWRQSVLDGFAAQDGLKGKIEEVGKTHMEVYQEKYNISEETYRKMAQSNREDFIGPVQRETNTFGQFIIDVFDTVAQAMGLSFSNAFEGIKNVVNAVIATVVNAVNAVVSSINAVIRAANQGLAAVGSGTRIPQLPTLSVPELAEGGVVNRPTLALIGEGNEREYVVPESKAPAFASNWMAGQRGNQALSNGGGSVPQINITTGPVMEFDGEKYVKLEDMERAMRATAEGVIGRLRTSSSRIALGMI
jgi:tape measure domain-containing protein